MSRFMVVSLVALTAGCLGEVDESLIDVSEIHQNALIESNVMWANRNQIHVCTTGGSFPLVREAVERSWSAESAMNFIWDETYNCSSYPTKTVGVHFDPQLGCFSTAAIGTTHLTEPFPAMSICEQPQISEVAVREMQIQDDAVHEFGHVLAFHHEHRRTDATLEDCPPDYTPPQYQTPGSGNTIVGPYDTLSVMNYCRHSNPTGARHAGRLSAYDIEAATAFYGDAFPFSMIVNSIGDRYQYARLNGPIPPFTTGGNLHGRRYVGSGGWMGWTDLGNLGGAPTSAPSAVGDGLTQHVFMRSATGTLAYYSKSNLSGVSTWQDLGGSIVGQPTAVKSGNRIVVLARYQSSGIGRSQELGIIEYDGSQWLPWRVIANPSNRNTSAAVNYAHTRFFTGPPAAVVGQDGSVIVVVQWMDGTLKSLRSVAVGSWPTVYTEVALPVNTWPNERQYSTVGGASLVAWPNSRNQLKIVLAVRNGSYKGTTSYEAMSTGLWYSMMGVTGTWSSLKHLATIPGGHSGRPSAIAVSENKVSVFVRRNDNGQIVRTDLNYSCFTSPRTGTTTCTTSVPGTTQELAAVAGTSGSPQAFGGAAAAGNIEVYSGNSTRHNPIRYVIPAGSTASTASTLPISLY